jgi:NADPH:quinone reductase-like Zn-dependent oxidoreductase
VTGVCSTTKVDLVRSLGADHVVDYRREDFAATGTRYDLILDIGGNTSLSRLRHGPHPEGTLVIVGGETSGKWLGGTRPAGPGHGAVHVRQPEAGHVHRRREAG